MYFLTNYMLAAAGVPFLAGIIMQVLVAYMAYLVVAQFADSLDQRLPKAGNYPIQTALKGSPIQKVYGRRRVAGNIIWLGPLRPYETRTWVSSGGGKGGGEEGFYVYETKYKRDFLIGICEGPAVVLKIWSGRKPMVVRSLNTGPYPYPFHPRRMIPDFPAYDYVPTLFDGNDNAGITALTGEEYGEYPNLCCAFYEDYILGPSQSLPNFTFEVESGTGLENKILIYDLAGLQAMNGDLTADYALMTDIDATPTETWNDGEGFVPIGLDGTGFIGTLDGRNHTIDGLYTDGSNNANGFFSWVGRLGVAAGHVKNLKLTNCDISGNGAVGMMVGVAKEGSTFTDCYAEGTVYTTGHNNGGFFGTCYDNIFTRCAAVGSVTIYPTNDRHNTGGFGGNAVSGATFIDCYARTIVSGGTSGGVYTGCFCGNDDEFNTFTRCYAAASIQYSNSSYDYNNDTKPIFYQGGGLVGKGNVNSTYASCYWDTEEGASVYPDTAKFASGYAHERQTHDIDADPTGGHFHISHDGHTTGEIDWDANEVAIQAACDAAFGASEFDIEFDGTDKWDNNSFLKLMFKGATYGQSPQADLTFDLTAMLPGGMSVVSSDDVTGVAPLSDAEITGKTTAQMQTESTFVGWDFKDVWHMGDSGYPELRTHRLDGCDMNPADIIKDIIENTRYGAGRTDIVHTTSFDAAGDYWDAQDMRISITLDETKPWQDWVDNILSHVGGYRFNSGGLLHLGALKSESAVFDLVWDDILQPNPDAKIKPPKVNITKRPQSDTFNRIEVNWTDRNNKYDNAVAVAYDVVDQARTGTVRKKVVKLAGIHNGPQAKRMAYRFLIDALYRFSVYKFGVTFKNMLLENGDVGTISDNDLLTSQKVRIMKIEEETNGRGLAILAMDDLAEHYPEITYANQGSLYEPPADVTLADMTVNFMEDVDASKIYLSCSPGNASFTAGFVYRSYDDISYDLLGRFGVDGVTGGDANSVGTTTGFIPAHPAVTWAPNESILVDIGTVTDLRTDVTEDEFWSDRYLAKIGDEIIAFKDAEETATAGIWEISNLRRGLFGTEPVAHSPSEAFCTLINDFPYIFVPGDIGRTLYFKVIASYGDTYQSVADVSAFSVTVAGYYQRPAAASLLRLSADENDGGSGEYSGATFTLYWNLGSRVSGFNYGDWLNLPWNNYTADPELEAVVLRFETEAGDLIGERIIAVANSATITKATDLAGNDRAVIKVIPRRLRRSRLENSILVESN